MGLFGWLQSRREKRSAEKFTQVSRWPNRIILLRHGESQGNLDKKIYQTYADSNISLTKKGFAQAVMAGLQMRQLLGNESVRFFVSPYMRTRQTLLAVLKAWDKLTVQVSAEPRLREQDFGNFQNSSGMQTVYKERQRFGRFYYRFPDGEAGTDVFDRMSSFIGYLFRTMDPLDVMERQRTDCGRPAENYVLVTHGLLMRIFCMCYLRWTVAEFEKVWNPSNCEIWVLTRNSSTYELNGRWRATPKGGSFSQIKFGINKTEPLYEHMKRPLVARCVTPGSPHALDHDELDFLRDLPGPSQETRSGRNQKLESGDDIVQYWAKDSEWASED